MIAERKAGVILSYLSMAVSVISGIIYVPFLLSTIGQEEYGLYQLLGGMITYASLFDFGLSNTVTRFYVKYKQEGDKEKLENVLALSRMLFWGLTLICLAAFLLIYFNLQSVFPKLQASQIKEGKIIFILLMVSICSTMPTYVYQAVSNAEEKFIFLRGITLLTGILQPICVILIVLKHPSAVSVVTVQAALNVALAIIKIAYVKLNLRVKFKFHGWDKILLKSLFSFSFFIFLNTLVDQINWEIGKTLVGILMGDTAAVTVLSLGLQLGKYYMMFSSNISSVFFPMIQRSIITDPTMREANGIFIKVGRIQALILGLILTGFVIFGQEFIAVWGGSENSGAFYIALALMLVLFIPLTQNTGISILQAKNIHKYRSLTYVILSAINLGISIPCILKMGEYGAAIGTVASFFIGNNVIINIFYKKKADIDISTYFKFFAKFVLFMAVLSVPLYFVNRLIIVHGYGLLIVKIIIYTAVYCVLVWLFIMNKYEKNLIITVFRKIGSKFKRKEAVNPIASDDNKVCEIAPNRLNGHIDIINKERCCGCEACVNVCPMHCITMKEDSEGFRYPYVDESKCIKCGACEKVCFYNKPIPDMPATQAFACYNTDDDERKISSSGGIFILLARKIIAEQGVVYGAAFDIANGAATMRAETYEECKLLQGSKYVQSGNNGCFARVKEDLLNGKKVLYTGTPCQINALKCYLGGIDMTNLYCMDIICHGVPSTLLYHKYVEYLETKYKQPVKHIYFRNKDFGWDRSVVVVVLNDGSVIRPKKYKSDYFIRAFLADILLRPSCLSCVSKNAGYSSDITVGDYWGYAQNNMNMFDNKGLSACLIRSEKGSELFNSVKESLKYKQSSEEDVAAGNPSLVHPNKQRYNRKKFLEELRVRDFDVAVDVTLKVPFHKKVFRYIKRKVKRILKK